MLSNKITKKLALVILAAASISLSSCMATSTAISKQDLEVKTKMSDSVFLNPVSPAQKTIYVSTHNTSDKQNIDIQSYLVADLQSKGYKIVSNPNNAHYILQANILKAGKFSPEGTAMVVDGALTGGALAGGVSAATGGSGGDIAAAAIIGGAAATAANALIKDVSYALITDVQIKERTKDTVKTTNKSNVKQGSSTKVTTENKSSSHWNVYTTRIASSAEKMNLKFEQAQVPLEKGLASSIAGLF